MSENMEINVSLNSGRTTIYRISLNGNFDKNTNALMDFFYYLNDKDIISLSELMYILMGLKLKGDF